MPRETLGDLEHHLLLAILRLGGEAYSVELVRELESRTGREVAQAAVFIVLQRLEGKALLRSRLEETRGRRVRRYFALTPAAVERLRESRHALLRLWEGVDSLLDRTT
jgi:DNA-binding PadR family transcriptional regulator